MSTSVGHPGFARAMGSVARELLGEPNPTLSSCQELRFGARGSMSIHLEKGTFHDHEAGHGGGVLDLVQLLLNLDKAAAIGWMRDRGYLLKNTPHTRSSRRQIATYNYVSADGKLLFQVVRFEPKSFQQRMPDGNGGWTWKTTGIQRVLYRLPDVIGAVAAGRTVYIVEGERRSRARLHRSHGDVLPRRGWEMASGIWQAVGRRRRRDLTGQRPTGYYAGRKPQMAPGWPSGPAWSGPCRRDSSAPSRCCCSRPDPDAAKPAVKG